MPTPRTGGRGPWARSIKMMMHGWFPDAVHSCPCVGQAWATRLTLEANSTSWEGNGSRASTLTCLPKGSSTWWRFTTHARTHGGEARPCHRGYTACSRLSTMKFCTFLAAVPPSTVARPRYAAMLRCCLPRFHLFKSTCCSFLDLYEVCSPGEPITARLENKLHRGFGLRMQGGAPPTSSTPGFESHRIRVDPVGVGQGGFAPSSCSCF